MPIYKMTDKNGKNIRKDGLQKYRVRVNYTDSFGKSHQIDRVVFGAEAAKQLELQLTQKLNAKEIAPKMTIGQLFTEYITAKRSEVRETSLDKSLRILRKNVLPTFESVRIDNLNVPMVQKWKQELSEQGLAIITRKNIYGEFRAMMNYAVKWNTFRKILLSPQATSKRPLKPRKKCFSTRLTSSRNTYRQLRIMLRKQRTAAQCTNGTTMYFST